MSRPAPLVAPAWLWRSFLLLAWYPLGIASFMLAGCLVQGLPGALMNPAERLELGLSLSAYVLSTIVPGLMALLRVRLHQWLAWGLSLGIFAGLWQLAAMLGRDLPVTSVLTLAVVAAALNFFLSAVQQGRWRLFLVPAGPAVLLALFSLPSAFDHLPAKWVFYGLQLPRLSTLETTVYPVQYQLFRAPLPRSALAGGGALASAGGKVALVTTDGNFYRLDVSPGGDRLNAVPLNYKVPINIETFRAQELDPEDFRQFRVHGALLRESADPGVLQVFVTHHYFHEADACTTLRLSTFSATTVDFLSGHASPAWRTAFETRPCLPLRMDGKVFFAGRQAGGRIQAVSATKLLVSVGDHAYDGVYTPRIAAQDMDSDYGKIVEVDTANGTHRVFSSGLRNPQGLYRDAEGSVWASDHGPKGGDELNLVYDGGNYGWPLATFGANYGRFTWPLQGTGPPELKLTPPVFAWLPSIGVSNLTGMDHGVFERWNGNLIMGSLAGKSVYRISLDDLQPVFIEPIFLGERIRDLTLDAEGRIVLWTDNNRIGLLSPLPDPALPVHQPGSD